MKRILITGAGGGPAINFTRSIRLAEEPIHLIGVDSDKYCLQRAETDERYLVPRCTEPDYVAVLAHLVKQTQADLLYSQPDVEIAMISESREQLPCRTFLPSKEAVRVCQNKYSSYEKWRDAGIRVPQTMMIHNEADLKMCFEKFGPRIWIREVSGAFGKGALPTSDFDQAKPWLDFHKGWGRFCGAECLSPQSVTWQSIWRDGELICAQSRRRLYWEFANRAPSGVTGITGTGVTMADPEFDKLAERTILAVDPKPNAIWSVDMTLDRDGVPNPTEINIARFFTTHLFFSAAGLNMPYIYVKLALGEEPPPIVRKINPLPIDLAWVRGMDCEPVLTTIQTIDSYETDLNKVRRELSGR